MLEKEASGVEDRSRLVIGLVTLAPEMKVTELKLRYLRSTEELAVSGLDEVEICEG